MRGEAFLAVLAASWLGFGVGGGALAQQDLDEPKTTPIFGQTRPEPAEDETSPPDDEFAGERRWRRASGLTGMFTFLTPDTTDLSVGVGPVYKPDYYGSDDYQFYADPAAYVRLNNFMFFDDDGADFALFGFSSFRFGPTLRIVGKRDQDDNPALAGLGDVGETFEFGGFAASTFLDRYTVRFKVRHGIKTGHRGTIVDANATALLFKWGPVSTSVSAQAAWIGDNYANAYFSITPEQSARSGLPVYDAEAGFRDIGGSFNAYINVGKRWSVNPYVSYRYIFDNYANTPIIADYGDRNQFTVGFHLMREFTFGRGNKTPIRN